MTKIPVRNVGKAFAFVKRTETDGFVRVCRIRPTGFYIEKRRRMPPGLKAFVIRTLSKGYPYPLMFELPA